jgi:hypothetical protein
MIAILDTAIKLLNAVRACVCTKGCDWHGDPHDWYAFKGDSGSYYVLPLVRMMLVPAVDCLAKLEPIRLEDWWRPNKVRTLRIAGLEWNVCSRCGIIDPGKFESERAHAIRDYDIMLNGGADESDEDVYRVGHRYYHEGNDGFVDEIDKDAYDRIVAYHREPVDEEEAAWLI